jgi:hypothetical protein
MYILFIFIVFLILSIFSGAEKPESAKAPKTTIITSLETRVKAHDGDIGDACGSHLKSAVHEKMGEWSFCTPTHFGVHLCSYHAEICMHGCSLSVQRIHLIV